MGPTDVLDPRQRIALGVAALSRSGRQVDRHARTGIPVLCPVVTFTAVEHVRARATGEFVIAGAAIRRHPPTRIR